MAKFSAIIVAVAVLAVYVSQDVLAQGPPDGTVPLGNMCEYRDQCDPSECTGGSSICCSGYGAAIGGKTVYASKSGKCTCCPKGCGAELGKADSIGNNTQANADAYHQGCKN